MLLTIMAAPHAATGESALGHELVDGRRLEAYHLLDGVAAQVFRCHSSETPMLRWHMGTTCRDEFETRTEKRFEPNSELLARARL